MYMIDAAGIALILTALSGVITACAALVSAIRNAHLLKDVKGHVRATGVEVHRVGEQINGVHGDALEAVRMAARAEGYAQGLAAAVAPVVAAAVSATTSPAGPGTTSAPPIAGAPPIATNAPPGGPQA